MSNRNRDDVYRMGRVVLLSQQLALWNRSYWNRTVRTKFQECSEHGLSFKIWRKGYRSFFRPSLVGGSRWDMRAILLRRNGTGTSQWVAFFPMKKTACRAEGVLEPLRPWTRGSWAFKFETQMGAFDLEVEGSSWSGVSQWSLETLPGWWQLVFMAQKLNQSCWNSGFSWLRFQA